MSPTLTDEEQKFIDGERRQLELCAIAIKAAESKEPYSAYDAALPGQLWRERMLSIIDRLTTQPQADAGERCSSFIVAVEDGGDWENPKVTHFKCLKCSGVGADHLTVKHYDHCALLAAPAPAAERSDPMPSYLLDEIWETHKDRDPRVSGWVMTIAKYRLSQARDRETIEALRTPAPVDAEKLAGKPSKLAADLSTILSSAIQYGTLSQLKKVAIYFNERELREIVASLGTLALSKARIVEIIRSTARISDDSEEWEGSNYQLDNPDKIADALIADIFAVPKPDKRLRVGQWALAQFIMDEIPKNHLHSATTVAGHIVDRFNDAVLVGSTETEKPA